MRDLFSKTPLLLGVVHLGALPGSPRFDGDRSERLRAARTDAEALIGGGLDGFVVENFGDRPFHRDEVEPITVAEMARIVADLRTQLGPDPVLGVNVLRNDARSALAVAAAGGADFIRVNVHTGAMLTDQGSIEGRADRTLRDRRRWEAHQVRIFADVGVKHALTPPQFDIAEAARETAGRGLADALIVSGVATGAPADLHELSTVVQAVPQTPVLVGSGADATSIASILELAQGVIVGTSIKEGGEVSRPVDVERVRRLGAAARNR